jgi:chromate reductase, NAD(P)H dehydrogenase (quinone)
LLGVAEGIPKAVQELKTRIAAAGGLLIVTPEYKNSIAGVLKNAIDWLSRPPEDIPRVFGARPGGGNRSNAGRGGASLSEAGWLPVLRALGTAPWFGGRMMVPNAVKVFDSEGQRSTRRQGRGSKPFRERRT